MTEPDVPVARLHFHDGRELDQPFEPGQTVPARIQHESDGPTVRTFAYRRGQDPSADVIHYDEWPLIKRTVTITPTS